MAPLGQNASTSMHESLIQPATEKANQVLALLTQIAKLLQLGHEAPAKVILAQINLPLGGLVSELGRLHMEHLNRPLRFQVETGQYNPDSDTDAGQEEYPQSPPAEFTISLISGIEVACGPLATIEQGDKPIIFIERQTTGAVMAVNSPDNGDAAAIVKFMPDGTTTIDDIPYWNSMVRDIREQPICGIVKGDFVKGFYIVGPFRTQEDAKKAYFYREGDLIVDFLDNSKKDERDETNEPPAAMAG